MTSLWEPEYRPVLDQFELGGEPLRIEYLAGVGGFSESRIWRVTTADRGDFCLKRYAHSLVDLPQLHLVHAVVQHAAKTSPVRLPLAIKSPSVESVVPFQGHLWDLTTWLEGQTVSPEKVTVTHTNSAMQALAKVHQAMATFPPPAGSRCTGIAPAVAKRLTRLQELTTQKREAFTASIDDRYGPAIRDAALVVADNFDRFASHVRHELTEANQTAVPLQWVIRDVWRNNVLFDDHAMATGLIDLTGLGFDSVATDIARFLGSFVENGIDPWESGLRSYKSVRELSSAERRLVSQLDGANVLLSGWNWIEWLFVERRRFSNLAEVEKRLGHFTRRIRNR